MSHKLLSLGLLAVVAGSLLSCKKDADVSPAVCYSGRVVAYTCMDGMLIEVTSAFPIGAPATIRGASGDSLLGRNLIAVVNTSDYGRMNSVGLTLHFTAVNDPNRQHSGFTCLAADGVKGPVPRLVLSNVGTTACGPGPR
ncbi:hypothetical protein [Hymenobacter antarcticus]